MRMAHNQSISGFMLLEALIALVIFALATTAFITILNTTLKTSKIIPDKTCALWVAQNQLALIIIDKTPRNTIKVEGNERQCGKQWKWKISIQDTQDLRIWQMRIAVFNGQQVEAIQYAFMPN